jgi:D-3-phosphoglycerate dehydrogenase / 2-oxoglutarate reductase
MGYAAKGEERATMGRTRKILIAAHFATASGDPLLQPLLDAGFELVWNTTGRFLTEDELAALLPNVVGTLAAVEPYTERVFAQAPELRVVSRFGVGYEKIDVEAATRHGVAIAMAFGGNHEAVADYALGLMLALADDIMAHDRQIKAGRWIMDLHPGLWGSTVGIVGLGRIGKAVARRCHACRTLLLAYEPQPDLDFVCEYDVRLVPLDTLLRESDFVTLHLPSTPATVGLMDRKHLALMKPTAYLINTARGTLVNEADLAEALASRRIAGAGLDVFAVEPPWASPLLTAENVVLSPHSAASDQRAKAAVLRRAVDSIVAVVAGRSPGPGLLLNPEVLGSAP